MAAGNSPAPGTEGATPGNGSDAPFGNGMGDTQSAGASTGAHDFVTDPKSHAANTGGRDFTKESKPQRMGAPEDINPDDMPPGGRLPFTQLDAQANQCPDVGEVASTPKHKPFR